MVQLSSLFLYFIENCDLNTIMKNKNRETISQDIHDAIMLV